MVSISQQFRPATIKMRIVSVRASAAVAAAALLPALTQAVQFTNSEFNDVKAGGSYTLTWSGDGSSVDIVLENGPSENLKPVTVLASAVSGTSTTVQIPAQLPEGTNAFQIMQSS